MSPPLAPASPSRRAIRAASGLVEGCPARRFVSWGSSGKSAMIFTRLFDTAESAGLPEVPAAGLEAIDAEPWERWRLAGESSGEPLSPFGSVPLSTPAPLPPPTPSPKAPNTFVFSHGPAAPHFSGRVISFQRNKSRTRRASAMTAFFFASERRRAGGDDAPRSSPRFIANAR